MVTPDDYADAVARAGRKPALKPDLVAEVYAAYETRKRRGGLVDFDDLLALVARALEEDDRLRRRPALAVPPPVRRRAAGREPAAVPAARGVARRPLRRHRGGRPAAGDLRVERRRRRLPARHPPLVAAGRGHRARAQLPLHAGDPRRRRGGAPRRPAAGPDGARPPGPTGAPPHAAGPPDDRAEAIAIARAVRLARAPGRPWSEQAVLVRTHAQTHLIAEALRGAGHPPPGAGGGRVPRPARRAPGPPRPAVGRRAAGHRAGRPRAAARGRAERRRRARRAGDDDRRRPTPPARPPGRRAARRWPPSSAWAATTCASTRSAGPTRSRAWLTATVQSEGDTGGPGRDAVDVATFHAAKGLEWATVHIAGAEDGYVPIAHARTAAARGRGGPPAVRGDDAGPARAAHHLGRAAHVRRQGGRPAPLAAARPAARRRRHGARAGRAGRRPRSPVDGLGRGAGPPARGPAQAEPAAAEPDPVLDVAPPLARRRRAGGPHRPRGRAPRPRAQPASWRPSPRDVEELGAVRGVGPILASRFGDAMLGRCSPAPGA